IPEQSRAVAPMKQCAFLTYAEPPTISSRIEALFPLRGQTPNSAAGSDFGVRPQSAVGPEEGHRRRRGGRVGRGIRTADSNLERRRLVAAVADLADEPDALRADDAPVDPIRRAHGRDRQGTDRPQKIARLIADSEIDDAVALHLGED